MKKLTIIASALLFLYSCAPVTYLGDRSTPTSNVDIYYSAHDVVKPYKVLGHMTMNQGTEASEKKRFADYAKKIGADAIVINAKQGTYNSENAYVTADALKYN